MGTSLGDIPFYVLGSEGSTTPPLLGAKTLREKKALVSYANGMFVYSPDRDVSENSTVHAVQMGPLGARLVL